MNNKIIKWTIANSCLMSLSLASAMQNLASPSEINTTNADPLYHQFMFDSAKLLQMNSAPVLGLHETTNAAVSDSAQPISNGFFLYKLQPTESQLSLPSNPFVTNASQQPKNSFYGHLFQRLMQHLFIDLAGGYEPTTNFANQFSPNTELYKYGYSDSYSTNWFARASALFTHTWKEFAFNANLGLTHAEANQDPYSMYFAQTMAPPMLGEGVANKVSFLHENAELSYRPNSLFQPFVAGGLLQVVNVNNGSQSLLNLALPNSSSLDPNDNNGYKFGGGLSLNYKQYVLRLEQQYYQRGNLNRANQSTLSFKVNLG